MTESVKEKNKCFTTTLENMILGGTAGTVKSDAYLLLSP